MRFAMWTVLLISSVLLGTALASHTHIGVGIYERGDRVGGLSDPYGRNEYDYGYSRGRISYEDDDYRRGQHRSSYDRQPSARYDRDRVDRYDRRSYDRSYGREGYDRRDSYLRGDRNSFRDNRGHNRGYDRPGSGDRAFDRYDRSDRYSRHDRHDRLDRPDRHDRHDRYDRFVQGGDNRRDYNDYNNRQHHDQRSYDRGSDRHSGYDRSLGYDQRSDRSRPRGYHDDRYPRPGPGSFFGQTRYPAGEGQYDRGYGRPAAGRIDGYEVRKYGWNLGGSRNVLNSGYDHGFAGSYQGGYGSAYYSKPAHYIAGVGSRLYS